MFDNTKNEGLKSIMLALLEAPEYQFIQRGIPAVNQLALMNKESMQTLCIADLRKEELGQSILCFEKKLPNDSRLNTLEPV
jgi:hypothetical protein